uniref:Uncharacterized protein n=1 Tax=viral metagenome TaxID=1070528 RepID=A0A6C0AM36_9ZZZZ
MFLFFVFLWFIFLLFFYFLRLYQVIPRLYQSYINYGLVIPVISIFKLFYRKKNIIIKIIEKLKNRYN